MLFELLSYFLDIIFKVFIVSFSSSEPLQPVYFLALNNFSDDQHKNSFGYTC